MGVSGSKRPHRVISRSPLGIQAREEGLGGDRCGGVRGRNRADSAEARAGRIGGELGSLHDRDGRARQPDPNGRLAELFQAARSWLQARNLGDRRGSEPDRPGLEGPPSVTPTGFHAGLDCVEINHHRSLGGESSTALDTELRSRGCDGKGRVLARPSHQFLILGRLINSGWI